MIELKRHGSYLEIDSDGYVQPVNQKIQIQPKWQPIIDDLIEYYKKHLDGIISIYIRGSVAKGEAIDGVSDVDSFCIVENDTNLLRDINETNIRFIKELQEKYPFCTHVELNSTQFLHLDREHPKRLRNVFSELIKTQSICVYGKDLAKDIAPFRIPEMIGHSLFIEEELNDLPNRILKHDGNLNKIRKSCAWISKRIVRSGFDLVIEREQKFTRDLYLCYESFSKYYPAKEQQMRAVLNLALNPISDTKEINVYLNDICPWLIAEIKNTMILNKKL